jgi:hypothetical protein
MDSFAKTINTRSSLRTSIPRVFWGDRLFVDKKCFILLLAEVQSLVIVNSSILKFLMCFMAKSNIPLTIRLERLNLSFLNVVFLNFPNELIDMHAFRKKFIVDAQGFLLYHTCPSKSIKAFRISRS